MAKEAREGGRKGGKGRQVRERGAVEAEEGEERDR